MKNDRAIVFTGGGTGGHVFPGLAAAQWPEGFEDLAAHPLLWIGSETGPEKNYVAGSPFSFVGIPSGKFRRYFSLKNFTDIFNILRAVSRAKKILKKNNAACVVSVGGYASVPAVLAARLLRIPVASLVCDLSLGLAAKITSRFSEAMLFAYETTRAQYAAGSSAKFSAKSLVPARKNQLLRAVGLPLRKEIREAAHAVAQEISRETAREIAWARLQKTYHLKKENKLLLVLGGSSGSAQINALLAAMLPALPRSLSVLHQTGSTPGIASPAGAAQYVSVPFLSDDYADALLCADAAFSRAGAGTLWELAACRVPAAVVPLGRAQSRGDQIENAAYFAREGAIINLESEPSADAARDAVLRIMRDETCARELREGCARIFSAHSAASVAEVVRNLVS